MPPVLQLRDVRLTLGGHPLLDGAELAVAPRERIALVGRNGSGKSTLLKIAAGQIEADGGTRFAQPGASMAYLQQEPDLSAFATVSDYILSGLGEEDDPYRARALMEELGVDPDARPGSLSGGEARRAALVRSLAPGPEVLLLDEPTNHLDLIAIEWLEKELAETRSAFVLISHDKRLLANLTKATVWLDRGMSATSSTGVSSWRSTGFATA
jgi:ABC transport system ATP-binding/permease protein